MQPTINKDKILNHQYEIISLYVHANIRKPSALLTQGKINMYMIHLFKLYAFIEQYGDGLTESILVKRKSEASTVFAQPTKIPAPVKVKTHNRHQIILVVKLKQMIMIIIEIQYQFHSKVLKEED